MVRAEVRKNPPDVDVETGELVDAPGVREAQAAKAHPDDPDFADVAGPAGQGEGGGDQPNTDEPPYASEGEPKAQDLALRAKAAGADWIALLRECKTEAQAQGIDYPNQASAIDKHPDFRRLVATKVAELEANAGPAQQELS